MLGQSCCSVPALGGVKAGGQDGRSSVATVHDLKNKMAPRREAKGLWVNASSGYERFRPYEALNQQTAQRQRHKGYQPVRGSVLLLQTTMGTFLRRVRALLILLCLKRDVVEGFAPSRNLLVTANGCNSPTTTQPPLRRRMASGDDNERSVMDEMNFFKADIPAEIRAEIFEAEAKTQAGQDRAGRLANYASIVVVGLGIAIFNTFLTGLQEDGSTLTEAGFGWVESNPLNSFLFTGKIGGAVALISAGLSAVMTEVEVSGSRKVHYVCTFLLHAK